MTTQSLCLLLALVAQPSQSTQDPKAIVLAASKAGKALRTVEYTTETTYVDIRIKGSTVLKLDGTKGGGFLPGKYRLRGNSDDGKGHLEFFEMTYDGTTLKIRDNDKTYNLTKPTEMEMGQYTPMMAMMGSFNVSGAHFERLLSEGAKLRWLGTKKIGAWNCDLVELKQTAENPSLGPVTVTAIWAFDRVSHLPVQLGGGKTTTTVTSLKLNPPVSDDIFKPDGKVRQVTKFGPASDDLIPIGKLAPNFTLKDPKGRTHSMAEYRGKVLVLDFWATWCIPCRKTMPVLQALHDRYKGKAVSIVGIALDPEFDVAAFMKRLGHTYPVLLKGIPAADKYRVRMLPTLYIIDQRGLVVHRQSGITKEDGTRIPGIVAQLVSKGKRA